MNFVQLSIESGIDINRGFYDGFSPLARLFRSFTEFQVSPIGGPGIGKMNGHFVPPSRLSSSN